MVPERHQAHTWFQRDTKHTHGSRETPSTHIVPERHQAHTWFQRDTKHTHGSRETPSTHMVPERHQAHTWFQSTHMVPERHQAHTWWGPVGKRGTAELSSARWKRGTAEHSQEKRAQLRSPQPGRKRHC